METTKLDEMILATAKPHWQKVAMIIAKLLGKPEFSLFENPDEFIAERIYYLVQVEKLESRGNINNWRRSEVRLA
jgi:hypothetical protein